MSPESKKQGKDCSSDPSTLATTPLRANAPRLSVGSRSRSVSPRKRGQKQPLHIRMNLTEMQMDKITDAFTSRVTPSPTKSHRRGGSANSRSTVKHDLSPDKIRMRYSLDSNDFHSQFQDSTTFSQLMPRNIGESHSQTLASRRQRTTPAPIRVVGEPRRVPYRPNMEAVPDEISPLSPVDITELLECQEVGSSAYTDYYCLSGKPEPLSLHVSRAGEGVSQFVQHGKGATRDPMNEFLSSSPNKIHHLQASTSQRPNRGHDEEEGERRYRGGSPNKATLHQGPNQTNQVESPLFSPFPFYFRGQGFPTEKRGEKILIGEKGWLERTENPEKEVKGKKTGILDGIKKIARDVTEFHSQSRRSQPVPKDVPGTQITISLDAREQSLLYGELEFHLANALNAYITIQLEKGRLMTDKLKKISDAWVQQGRPRVLGFRYDLETQLELVQVHLDDFVFSGRRQGNPVEIAGLLHAMRVNARAMRVRTFCQPDSVIAKQLVDSQSLFNMLGVGRAEDQALAEIAQFFKVCVERERNSHQKELFKAQKSRMEHRKRQENVGEDGETVHTQPPGFHYTVDTNDEWLHYPA